VTAGRVAAAELRDVAVLGHATVEHHAGRPVLGHAEEQVLRQLGAVVEDHGPARGIERGDATTGDQPISVTSTRSGTASDREVLTLARFDKMPM
jgi:hypothetical protein